MLNVLPHSEYNFHLRWVHGSQAYPTGHTWDSYVIWVLLNLASEIRNVIISCHIHSQQTFCISITLDFILFSRFVSFGSVFDSIILNFIKHLLRWITKELNQYRLRFAMLPITYNLIFFPVRCEIISWVWTSNSNITVL